MVTICLMLHMFLWVRFFNLHMTPHWPHCCFPLHYMPPSIAVHGQHWWGQPIKPNEHVRHHLPTACGPL